MHRLTLQGPAGEIRWSYHQAATLSDWHVTAAPEAVRLSATIVQQDPVKVSQRPLTFVVRRPTGAWRWPIQSLQITGSQIQADLGPQE
jgi:hypothetical protein